MKVVFYRNDPKAPGGTTFATILLDYRFGKTFEELIQTWREREEQDGKPNMPFHDILVDLSLAIRYETVRVEAKP